MIEIDRKTSIMPKKIMIINGSPRKEGNTATLINWVTSGALEAGAEVEIVDAVRLENKNNGCIGCRSCNKSDDYRCVVKDETSSLITRMLEKDVVAFATPVYFGSFSAQMKRLIDRMYCFKKVHDDGSYSVEPALKGVSLALIATAGGDKKSGLGFLSKHMQGIAAGLGKEIREFMVPLCPAVPGEMASNLEVQEKAIAFGEQLAR